MSDKEIDIFWMIVKAGDMGKSFTACHEKGLTSGDADFLQCLEAVGRKCRGDDQEVFFSFAGQAFEFTVGVRLEPGLAGEAGLERHRPARGIEAGAGREGTGGVENLRPVAGGM